MHKFCGWTHVPSIFPPYYPSLLGNIIFLAALLIGKKQSLLMVLLEIAWLNQSRFQENLTFHTCIKLQSMGRRKNSYFLPLFPKKSTVVLNWYGNKTGWHMLLDNTVHSTLVQWSSFLIKLTSYTKEGICLVIYEIDPPPPTYFLPPAYYENVLEPFSSKRGKMLKESNPY